MQCWFLAGPTACGKSAAALILAENLNAEILSLDSMAVFKQMDIGTAKPSPADQQRIPHHLIDLVEPHDEFSVADYLRYAEHAVHAILNRGRVPLFVGGTGLYLRSALRGIFEAPSHNPEVRQSLEDEARTLGPDELHKRLQTIDPDTAARLHPNDQRRVIRALEVAHTTGKPLSSFQQHGPTVDDLRAQHVFWLDPPRNWLYDRINTRVEQMLVDGLLSETRAIWESESGFGRTAQQALGYRELIAHLDGEIDLPTATELIQRRTRQFAKRQLTWFRNLEECRPIPLTGNETASELAQQILAFNPSE